MMKLKDKDIQPPMAGLPGSRREWWNLGDEYEIFIILEEKNCRLLINGSGEKDITLHVAEYLGLDTTPEKITFGVKANGRELYLSLGIDCVAINYTKPENYKELLKKIEVIVNEHFKYK